ncbi:MAG: hypothetical protein R3Y58_03240 [Eubacteriales bacterium]
MYTLHNWGYENVKEFLKTYNQAGQESEDYDKAVVLGGMMNNFRSAAEEVVLKEVVYC